MRRRLSTVLFVVLAAVLADSARAEDVGFAPAATELHARTVAAAARCIEATVGLVVVGDGDRREVGSGVIVTADGLILTAAHVLHAPGRTYHVAFADGSWGRCVSLGVEPERDVGMARLVGDGPWSFAEPADGQVTTPGDWLLAAGHPGGVVENRAPRLRLGRALAVSPDRVETACAVISGDSGGPLFDLEGRVIGIHTEIGLATDENRHVPIAAIRGLWDRLVAGEAIEDAAPVVYPERAATELKSFLLDLRRSDAAARRRLATFVPDAAARSAILRALRAARRDGDGSLRLVLRDTASTVALAAVQRGLLREAGRPLPSAPPDGIEGAALLVRESVLELIDSSGARVGLATAVRADGLLIAKASLFEDVLGASDRTSLRVRTGGRLVQMQRVAHDTADDVALLRIDRELRPVVWPLQDVPAPGAWLVSPDADGAPARFGIVSGTPAPVPQQRRFFVAPDRGVLEPRRTEDDIVRVISEADGGTSARRRGFTVAFAHDTAVPANSCGGPVVDLLGRPVAWNVARHDRTATFAIPAERMAVIVGRLLAQAK